MKPHFEYVDRLCDDGEALVFAAQQWASLEHKGNNVDGVGLYTFDSTAAATILKTGDDIIGLATHFVSGRHSEYLWVDFICVGNSNRGNGFCKQILDELYKLAKSKGCFYVEFGTHRNNEAMRTVAHKSGFEADSVNFRKFIKYE